MKGTEHFKDVIQNYLETRAYYRADSFTYTIEAER